MEFTKSLEFSDSDYLNRSKPFSKTKFFSQSNDFTKTSDFSNSKEFTTSSQFTKTRFFSNSKEFSFSETLASINIPVIEPDQDTKERNKSNTGLIAGVSAAAAAVLIIVVIAAVFFIKKKKNLINEEDVETITDTTGSIHSANPIFSNEAEDDPFKEDFQ